MKNNQAVILVTNRYGKTVEKVIILFTVGNGRYPYERILQRWGLVSDPLDPGQPIHAGQSWHVRHLLPATSDPGKRNHLWKVYLDHVVRFVRPGHSDVSRRIPAEQDRSAMDVRIGVLHLQFDDRDDISDSQS